MSLNLKFRLKARCKKHPLFNPEKQGEAGVRGGCTVCLDLLAVYQAYTNLVKQSGEFVTGQKRIPGS